MSQTGVVISEIQPNKWKVAKSLKRWKVELVLWKFETITVLACLEK